MVKQARTFYGPEMWFDEWADMQPVKSQSQILADRRMESLKERARAIGFREPSAVESADVYETALKHAERETPRGELVSMLARAKRL